MNLCQGSSSRPALATHAPVFIMFDGLGDGVCVVAILTRAQGGGGKGTRRALCCSGLFECRLSMGRFIHISLDYTVTPPRSRYHG